MSDEKSQSKTEKNSTELARNIQNQDYRAFLQYKGEKLNIPCRKRDFSTLQNLRFSQMDFSNAAISVLKYVIFLANFLK